MKYMLRHLPIVLVCLLSALAAFAVGVAEVVPPMVEIAIVVILALSCAGVVTHLITSVAGQRDPRAPR